MKKKFLIVLTLGLVASFANAQGWDDSGDGWGDSGDTWDDSGDGWGTSDDATADDGSYDYAPGSGSGSSDTSGGDAWSDDSWGGDDDSWGSGDDYGSGGFGDDYVRSSRPKVEHKAYERFTGMPYDSATQLVTYVEIVEVIVPDRFLDLGGDDYSLSDSLYQRALAWMNNEFGKKEAKQMIDHAGADAKGKEGQTLKAYVTMPLIVELNKYQKINAGLLEFDMELRFKDERYRYKFENFIHVEENSALGNKGDITYMEYYLTAKKNVQRNDKILMACNDQINKLIENLKETCAHTPFVDDDDW